MKLEKFEKFVDIASKGLSKYDFFVILISYFVVALSRDLNLENLYHVSGGIFLLELSWYLSTFVCLIVLVIIKKVRSKKTNIEKLIDE